MVDDRVITGNYGEDDQRMFKCDACGEETRGHPFYGELNEDPLCETCWRWDAVEPTAVVVDCRDGDRFTYRLGSYRIDTCDGDVDDDDVAVQLCKTIRWVSTDPWRGYHIFDTPKGWINVIADWCGIDGFNLIGDLGDFYQRWQVEKGTPPFHMIAAFPRGSNLCSTIIDVWVEEGNEEAFKAWLKNES